MTVKKVKKAKKVAKKIEKKTGKPKCSRCRKSGHNARTCKD